MRLLPLLAWLLLAAVAFVTLAPIGFRPDAASGKELTLLRGHTSEVASAAFSPDGTRVVTASQDGTARIYACELCGSLNDLIALARTRIADIAD